MPRKAVCWPWAEVRCSPQLSVMDVDDVRVLKYMEVNLSRPCDCDCEHAVVFMPFIIFLL